MVESGMPSLSGRPWTIPLILFTAILAAYVPALMGGFVWDDDSYLTANPTLDAADGLRRIWADPSASPQYYPLVFTTFWVERRIFGEHPFGYHLDNVLLHSANAVLLGLLLTRLAVPGAWLAAALFGLHPVCVESVAWITERKNVLSVLFLLLSAIAWESFGRTRRWRSYAACLALFVAALLSKSVAAVLPALLLVDAWRRTGRVTRREFLPAVPLFVIGLAAGLSTARLERLRVGAEGPEWDFGLGQRLVIAGRALWFYLGKAVWPSNLTFIYPRWETASLSGAGWLYPASFVLLAAALWAWGRRVGRGPAAALACFAVTLAPTLGFLNVYPMRFSFVADHFQYPAIAFPLAAAAALGAVAAGREPRICRAAPVLLLVLGFLTFRQTVQYRDAETLWRATLERNSGSWMVHANLGNLLHESGRTGEALEHFLAAERLYPDHVSAYRLGLHYLKTGRDAEAWQYFAEAARRKADYIEPRVALAGLLYRLERYDEAVAMYGEVIPLAPDNWQVPLQPGPGLGEGGAGPGGGGRLPGGGGPAAGRTGGALQPGQRPGPAGRPAGGDRSLPPGARTEAGPRAGQAEPGPAARPLGGPPARDGVKRVTSLGIMK